eukprot:gene517-652_t
MRIYQPILSLLLLVVILISNSSGHTENFESKINNIIEAEYKRFEKDFAILKSGRPDFIQSKSMDLDFNPIPSGHLPGYNCQHEHFFGAASELHKQSVQEINNNNTQPFVYEKLSNNIGSTKNTNAVGKIRFLFNTDMIKNNNDKYACYSVGQEIVVGGTGPTTNTCDQNKPVCNYKCTKNDVLDQQLSEFVISYVLSAIEKVFTSFLQIEQTTTLKLIPDRAECHYGVPIPATYFNPGVNDVDYIVFVTIRPATDNMTIAYAGPCNFRRYADYLGRPLAGIINFNPIYFKPFINNANGFIFSEYVKVGIHEMTHALGFSSGFYSSYIDRKTGLPYKDLGFEGNTGGVAALTVKGFTPNNVAFTTTRNVLVTPRVVAFVQDHYNAPDLAYQELEDIGGAGTVGSHWEKRVVGEEIMLGFIDPVLPFTNLTLSLLEDTGWYTIDYSNADPLMWGKKLGIEWFQDCKPTTWDYPGYWCDVQTRGSRCSPTRSGKGYCSPYRSSSPVPLPYQHFKDTTLIGDEVADGCPFSDMVKGPGIPTTYYCQDKSNTGDSSIKEVYGDNSRCFEYKSGFTSTTNMACWEQRCTGGNLEIKANGVWASCPSGETKKFDGLEVICPRFYYPCANSTLDIKDPNNGNLLSVSSIMISLFK